MMGVSTWYNYKQGISGHKLQTSSIKRNSYNTSFTTAVLSPEILFIRFGHLRQLNSFDGDAIIRVFGYSQQSQGCLVTVGHLYQIKVKCNIYMECPSMFDHLIATLYFTGVLLSAMQVLHLPHISKRRIANSIRDMQHNLVTIIWKRFCNFNNSGDIAQNSSQNQAKCIEGNSIS